MSSSIAFLRGAKAEPFSEPLIELAGNSIAVVLRQVFHALVLGEILADAAVGAAFPRMMGRDCRYAWDGLSNGLDDTAHWPVMPQLIRIGKQEWHFRNR